MSKRMVLALEPTNRGGKVEPPQVEKGPTSGWLGALGYVFTKDGSRKLLPQLIEHFNRIPKIKLHKKMIPELLGKGADGFAFGLDNKLVLKITKDESEASAMNTLRITGKSDFFVDVYGVIKVNSAVGVRHCILMERLNKPDPTWALFINQVGLLLTLVSVKTESIGYLTEEIAGDIAGIAQLIRDGEEVHLPGFGMITDKHVRAFDPDKLEWLRGVGAELDRLEIGWGDFHSGNIMRRGADHVMIDLGRSYGGVEQGIEDVQARLRRFSL